MGKRPVQGRGPEYELIRQFSTWDRALYGQRGTCSDGVDVLLFKQDDAGRLLAWRFEVKSSKSDCQSLKDTERMYGQYLAYLAVLRNYRVMTFYAFRCKSTKQRGKDEADKWRLFRVDRLPKSRNGTPKLTLKCRAGWSVKEFYEKVIRGEMRMQGR